MENCLFCKIVNGEIPSEKIYEDDFVYAFNDIDKKAPVHVLIVPKFHMDSIMEIDKGPYYIEALFKAANIIAKDRGLDKNGFRLVINTGKDAGQTVNHLHLHLLGGRNMDWPPG